MASCADVPVKDRPFCEACVAKGDQFGYTTAFDPEGNPIAEVPTCKGGPGVGPGVTLPPSQKRRLMRKITKAQLIGGALFAGLALADRRRRGVRYGWIPKSDGEAIVVGFLMGAGLIAATAPLAPFFFADD